MSRSMQVWGRGVVLAVAGLLLIGCSSDKPASEAAPLAQAPSSPTATPGPVTPDDKEAVRETVDTVRDYLAAWATDGPARASHYLVSAMRATSDEGMPRLVSGTVESYEVRSWHGPDRFTLMVVLDLEFDGSPSAWNRGRNARFVTPHRQGPQGHPLLEFASSP